MGNLAFSYFCRYFVSGAFVFGALRSLIRRKWTNPSGKMKQRELEWREAWAIARGSGSVGCFPIWPLANSNGTLRRVMANKRYIDCIEACNHCANECTYCASECLRESDVKAMARCIELDRDCSTLCRAASLLMSADSQFAPDICGLCAEACHACAEECRKHDMEHCRQCAEACERCALECEKMAGALRT